jgi:hypothetical protein
MSPSEPYLKASYFRHVEYPSSGMDTRTVACEPHSELHIK